MRYGLTQENKGAADIALDFPALKLKRGEVARLALFSLQKGEDGKQKLALPDPDGGYYWSLTGADDKFLGRYECLADEDVKKADEFQPEKCAHCQYVQDGVPEEIVGPRKRRFVMHVIRYNTQPGKSALSQPPSVQALAWVFPDRYFNALVDENERWSKDNVPGLLGHDISLLCEVEDFQTFKVSVEPESAWRADPELGKQVLATYLGAVELAPNLTRKLGNTLTSEQLRSKIESALRGAGLGDSGPAMEPMQVDESLIKDLGLGEELFGPTGAIPEPALESALSEAAADEVAEVGTVDLGALTSEAPAEAAPEAPQAPSEGVSEEPAEAIDFDSFFPQK